MQAWYTLNLPQKNVYCLDNIFIDNTKLLQMLFFMTLSINKCF